MQITDAVSTALPWLAAGAAGRYGVTALIALTAVYSRRPHRRRAALAVLPVLIRWPLRREVEPLRGGVKK